MFETIPPEGTALPGGRYVLRRLLGRGGFGDAFLADDVLLHRPVVVKLLVNLSDESMSERFLREARIAANIRHPSVAQVYDFGAVGENPFYVMEYVDGQTLTDFAKAHGGVLPIPLALNLVAEVAEGLAAAHKNKVIHRDVKPDNVLVSDGHGQPHAKLIDFGIAKQPVAGAGGVGAPVLTKEHRVLGTPRFMSPEQAMHKPLDGASDFYSLGCVLYLMLTGRTPFEGTALEMMTAHVQTPAPSLSAAASGRTFLPELDAVVARLLAKDPTRRWTDGNELAATLRGQARRAEISALGSDPTTNALLPVAQLPPSAVVVDGAQTYVADSRVEPARDSYAAARRDAPTAALEAHTTAPAAVAPVEVAAPRRRAQTVGLPVTPPMTAATGDHALARDPTGASPPPRKGSKVPLVLGVMGALLVVGAVAFGVLSMGAKPAAGPPQEPPPVSPKTAHEAPTMTTSTAATVDKEPAVEAPTGKPAITTSVPSVTAESAPSAPPSVAAGSTTKSPSIPTKTPTKPTTPTAAPITAPKPISSTVAGAPPAMPTATPPPPTSTALDPTAAFDDRK